MMGLLGFSSCLFFWIFFCAYGGVPAAADVDVAVAVAVAVADPSQPAPLPPPALPRPNFSPFRPSIAVIVGVLTTMFSITFLLLLYAKHCKRGRGAVYTGTPPLSSSSAPRKNSGIDRAVIESLPVFRFASLRGHKDGLECAVCLNRFEPTEILRLLPKCKHAFHVECVDTWLDAHSTCPLCRYRVDPEDILLVENPKISLPPPPDPDPDPDPPEEEPEFRRISGRHSSAGERRSGLVQIVLHKPDETASSSRRSLDSSRKRNEPIVGVGCFDRPRKDQLLLTSEERGGLERRLDHRILVSGAGSGGFQQRWSDVQPSDLLYLRSEMIISDGRRLSSVLGSRPSLSSKSRQHRQSQQLQLQQQQPHSSSGSGSRCQETMGEVGSWNGRSVINSRSVSEITGLSRLGSNYHHLDRQHQQRQAGVVSRWLAWISQRPSVRSQGAVALAL